MRVYLFGSIDIRNGDDARSSSVLAQPKRTALLAYLAASGPGTWVRRSSLLAMFWPESDETKARNALNKALHHLRRSLGAEAVISRGPDEICLSAEHVWCDVDAFWSALRSEALEEALEIHARGPFLAGLDPRDLPDFEGWRSTLGARLDREALEAARRLTETAYERGDLPAAVRWAWAAHGLAPYSEPILQRLMALLDAAGDRAGALRAHAEFAARLARDLEVAPSPETARIADALRDPGTPPRRGEGPSPARPLDTPPDTPPPAPAPAGPAKARGHRLLRRPALASLGILAVAAALWAGFGDEPSEGVGDGGASTVVVFPFPADGAGEAAFLGDAMVDLLSTALDDGDLIRSVDPRSILEGEGPPRDPAAAARLVRRLKADLFVMGRVVAQGGDLRLTGALYRASGGSAVAEGSAQGSTEKPLQVVDRLAATLLAEGVDAGRRSVARTAALTTELPALKAFLRGEEMVRRGDVHRAVAAYEEAVDADTSFALAYYRLARLGAYNDVDLDTGALFAEASRFAAQLPFRYRSALKARRARDEGRPEAEGLLREYVLRYPDDADGWFELGDWHLHWDPLLGRGLGEAARALDRAVALDSTHFMALGHQWDIEVLEGRPDEARDALGRLPAGNYRHAVARLLEILDGGGEDPVAEAGRFLDSLEPSTAALAVRWSLSLGDHPEAEEALMRRQVARAADPGLTRVRTEALVWVLLKGGKVDRAWDELDVYEARSGDPATAVRAFVAALPWAHPGEARLERTLDLLRAEDRLGNAASGSQERWARERSFLGALVAYRLGRPEEARLFEARLASPGADSTLTETGRRLAASLEAWRASGDGDLPRARSALALASPGTAPVGTSATRFVQRYLTAETLERMGDPAGAGRWYRSLVDEYTDTRSIAFRGAALLGEARTLEAQGEGAGARAHLDRVALLWAAGDAHSRPDPGVLGVRNPPGKRGVTPR